MINKYLKPLYKNSVSFYLNRTIGELAKDMSFTSQFEDNVKRIVGEAPGEGGVKVRYQSGVLTIIQRLDADYNTRITMKRALANDLFVVYKAELIPIGFDDFSVSASNIMLDGSYTDLISPYAANDGGSFMGGNHLYGGMQTANHVYVKVWLDAELITSDFILKTCKEVLVETQNILFKNLSLPDKITALVETQTYKISDNNIDVSIRVVSQLTLTISFFYGCMNVITPVYNRIYVAHSAINTINAFSASADYGDYSSYPNVEKAIFTDAATKYCIDVWLDTETGLAKNPRQNINKCYIVEGNKCYHVPLYGFLNVTPGAIFRFRGGYKLFKNMAGGDWLSVAKMVQGTKRLYVDYCNTSAATIAIDTPVGLVGKQAKVLRKDATIDVDDYFPLTEKINIKATGYGNVEFQIL
jgi:hypothetical protein